MKNGLIIKRSGDKKYYLNDQPHREGGPAIEFINGNKYWYYYGVKILVRSQEDFIKHIDLLIYK